MCGVEAGSGQMSGKVSGIKTIALSKLRRDLDLLPQPAVFKCVHL